MADERPVVKRTARAILLDYDPAGASPPDMILIKRTKPSSEPYWITPGGGVEPGVDATVVEALHREVNEELGAKIVDVVPAFVDTVQHGDDVPAPTAGERRKTDEPGEFGEFGGPGEPGELGEFGGPGELGEFGEFGDTDGPRESGEPGEPGGAGGAGDTGEPVESAEPTGPGEFGKSAEDGGSPGPGEAPGVKVQHFFACRLASMDPALRHGPEVEEPLGEYEIVRIPFTRRGIASVEVVPPSLRAYLRANIEGVQALLAPDLG